jgi:sugar phosphate isomerase/epimerase
MMKEMMEKVEDPRINICLDVGHGNAMTIKDVDIVEWLKVLGPYITHFHLHNNDGTGDSHSAFDEGTMDMKGVLLAIEDYCPEDVTYTIEARKAMDCLQWLEDKSFI